MSLHAAQWHLKQIKADLDTHEPVAVDNEWIFLYTKLTEVVNALLVEPD